MPGSLGSRGLARMPEQRSQIFKAANVCAVQEVAKGPRAGGKNEWTWFSPQGYPILSHPHHLAPSQLPNEHRDQSTGRSRNCS